MSLTEEIISDLRSSDPLVRNKAALKLIDHKNEGAVSTLLESCLNPNNIGFNGTLVFSLSYFDCSLYFPQLVKISITHDYEASTEAMSIINEQELSPSKKQKEEALLIINEATSKEITEDQAEALNLIKTRYYKINKNA